MRRLPAAVVVAALLAACSPAPPTDPQVAAAGPGDARLGSPAWYAWVDRSLGISSDGHGPDHGTPEWNQAVQRRLGEEAPQARPGSPEWQQAVDALLRTRGPSPQGS